MNQAELIAQFQEKLSDRIITKVSETTGISEPTLHKIRLGKAKRLHYDTVKALSDYFGIQNVG